MRRFLTCIAAVAVGASIGLSATAARAEISGPADIKDGDTFDIGLVRIRLHGIDAPELAQTCATRRGGEWNCGSQAADRLANLTAGKTVTCEGRERDAYGRIIAVCRADGIDLGETLVAEGLAWAYLEYSDDYIEGEARARAAGTGIWQQQTMTAWEYRDNRWARAAGESPRAGCPIKGNISAGGDRIYHTPWSKYYGRTRIDTSKGEAWFCDENEAVAAGWRASGGH